MSGKYIISPSVLSADMAALGDEVKLLEKAQADWIHIDVMDGRFVPNITIGIPVLAALNKRTELPLDVHLMIMEPEHHTEAFIRAGASCLTVHAEATLHLYRLLQGIQAAGAKSGVAINPSTPASLIEHVLEVSDLVLVMTVEPGFGGQAFIPSMLPKVEWIANEISRRQLAVDIQVDGGIKDKTIGRAASAGANVFVSGSGVFGHGDPDAAIRRLRAALPAR